MGVCRPESVGKLARFGDRITVYPGRTNDREVVARAVKGCDGVLTMLAPWGVSASARAHAEAGRAAGGGLLHRGAGHRVDLGDHPVGGGVGLVAGVVVVGREGPGGLGAGLGPVTEGEERPAAGDVGEAVALPSSGRGVTILPRDTIRVPGVRAVPIVDLPLSRVIEIATVAGRPLSNAARRFTAFMTEFACAA